MPNPSMHSFRNHQRIDAGSDFEVSDWSDALGVSPEQLRHALDAVGSDVEDVCAQLRASARAGAGGTFSHEKSA